MIANFPQVSVMEETDVSKRLFTIGQLYYLKADINEKHLLCNANAETQCAKRHTSKKQVLVPSQATIIRNSFTRLFDYNIFQLVAVPDTVNHRSCIEVCRELFEYIFFL